MTLNFPDNFPQEEPAKIVNPRTYIFTFGKYKGETYRTVKKHDAAYIEWADDSVDFFTLSDDERLDIQELVEQQQDGTGDWHGEWESW